MNQNSIGMRQSIQGTSAIFTNLGTAVRAAGAAYDGSAPGRTKVGSHPGTLVTSANQTYYNSTSTLGYL